MIAESRNGMNHGVVDELLSPSDHRHQTGQTACIRRADHRHQTGQTGETRRGGSPRETPAGRAIPLPGAWRGCAVSSALLSVKKTSRRWRGSSSSRQRRATRRRHALSSLTLPASRPPPSIQIRSMRRNGRFFGSCRCRQRKCGISWRASRWILPARSCALSRRFSAKWRPRKPGRYFPAIANRKRSPSADANGRETARQRSLKWPGASNCER
jgi:hypothetical protein